MVIREFIIRVVAKYSGKGFDEAEADIDGFKRGAKGASKGLSDLQKETRKAKAEARAFAKQEREAAKALRERERATAKAAATLAKARAARARTARKMVSDTEKAVEANKRLAKTNANRIAQQIAKREKKVADAIAKQAKAADKAARANKRLREAQERASLVALGLARAEGKAATATNRAGDEARKSSSGWSAIGAEFAGVAGAAGGVALGIGAVVAPVLLVGAKFQSLRAQLDNLLGSAEGGKKAFDFIQDFAVKTPFMLDEVTTAFVKLEGRGIKPTTKTLTSLGDLASANRKSLDDVTEAVLDATQGEGERLKELGIKMKVAGDNVSLSFRGQTLSVQKNEKAITDAIVKLGEMKGIAGSMAVQMDTLSGQFSNAAGSVVKFLNSASQTGGLERAGEILTILGDKLINPTNARLFGEAIDEILTTIRDGLKDVEPGTITDGFRALLNVIKLLAIALKPFIALWRAGLSLLERISDVTDSVLQLAEAFEGLVTGQLSVADAAEKTAMAFGLIDDASKTATLGMDKLKTSALDAIQAVKKAVTNAFLEDATDDELQAIAANENAAKSTRAAATKELSERKSKTKKTRALEARETDRARKGFEQRRGGPGDKGKKGKGKGSQFFDFAEQAKSAALAQGEEFAANELQNLIASGLKFEEAQKQARAAGKERASELEAEFRRTGEITKGGGTNILDILGLKGPGSMLKDRPAPTSLIIAPVFNVTMIGEFNQTNAITGGADEIEQLTNGGAQAAVASGIDQFKPMLAELVKATMGLEMDRVMKMAAGGRQPAGPQG